MTDSPTIIDPPANDPPRPDSRRKITCEFCECELGMSGEYKQLSETAKRYRKLKDDNEKLEGTLATVRQEKEDLARKLEELKPKDRGGDSKRGLML